MFTYTPNKFSHYRQPTNAEWRLQWDKTLSNQPHSNGNLICIEYFNDDDYNKKFNKIALKQYAVPTIFAENINENVVVDEFSHVCCGIDNAVNMSTKIEQLEAEIEDLRTRCAAIDDEKSEQINILIVEQNALKEQLNEREILNDHFSRFALDRPNDQKVRFSTLYYNL